MIQYQSVHPGSIPLDPESLRLYLIERIHSENQLRSAHDLTSVILRQAKISTYLKVRLDLLGIPFEEDYDAPLGNFSAVIIDDPVSPNKTNPKIDDLSECSDEKLLAMINANGKVVPKTVVATMDIQYINKEFLENIMAMPATLSITITEEVKSTCTKDEPKPARQNWIKSILSSPILQRLRSNRR